MVATPESRSAVAIGRTIGRRDGDPGTAPTEGAVVRGRAMVEIAKELGADALNPSDHIAISGAVTQEMLDRAENAYASAVQEAWEAHGFPWTDSDVLRTLGDLEALVSALESIVQAAEPGNVVVQAVTDTNNDGFVDINDLWDMHLQYRVSGN